MGSQSDGHDREASLSLPRYIKFDYMAIWISLYLYWHSICISIRRNKLRKFYNEHPYGLKIFCMIDSVRKVVNIEGCCC